MPYGQDEHRWRNQFEFDEAGLITIDYVHWRVHESQMHIVNYVNTALASNATASVLFAVGVSAAHSTIQRSMGGNSLSYLYEGATVTGASGTGITAYCLNRQAPGPLNVKFFAGPEGVSATGTAIGGVIFHPGGGGPQANGSTLRPGTEWVFAPNKNYLMQVVNLTNGAIPVGLSMEWYEE